MDRRTQKLLDSKERMADALLLLMHDQPMKKVTPQMVCDHVGMARVTWFRYFSSKEEAIAFKLGRIWKRWVEAHPLEGVDDVDYARALRFFGFFWEYRDIFKVLQKDGVTDVALDPLFEKIADARATTTQSLYANHFNLAGLYGIVVVWIRRDFAETPEEMAQIARQNFHIDSVFE